MKKSAKDISNALQYISEVCFSIKDSGGCDGCPMKYVCLEEEDVIVVADLMSTDSWQEFLDYEDEAAAICSRENAEAEYWDNKRKADIEERMIDEYE